MTTTKQTFNRSVFIKSLIIELVSKLLNVMWTLKGMKTKEFVLHVALSSFLNFTTENKTWLDSMKTMAERLPEAANRFASKKEKESMASTGGSTGGIRFVNYVDFSDPDSGISAVCCFLWWSEDTSENSSGDISVWIVENSNT